MRRQGSSAQPGARRSGAPLDALFAPRTVAVVGASDDSAKWGHIIGARALASRGDRAVLLVTHSPDLLDGRWRVVELGAPSPVGVKAPRLPADA